MKRLDQAHRDQPSLFDSRRRSGVIHKIPGVTTGADIERRLTRDSHPDTSREAASRLCGHGRLTENAGDALALVRAYPGSTGYELDAMREHGDEGRIRKRLSDLAAGELVERGKARKCETKGSKCVTWWPMGQLPKEQKMVTITKNAAEMPGGLSATTIPEDQNGEAVCDGNQYLVSTRGAAEKVEVIFDPASGDLMYRKWQSDHPWASIFDRDASASWELCE